jgi:hypothetical protein
MPKRYSRHYYDLCQLSQSRYSTVALSDFGLLRKVVDFKNQFYRDGWANYDDALIGKIKLVPPKERLDGLASDYQAMKEMIFGEAPSFGFVVLELSQLEKEINEKCLEKKS